ncbi:hypothetical protein [Labrys wisconsinensis]|uniref:Uncharacterized protein n=1 Tax=Labrys wisconsinensis TaxID=425677 RepID=A0ABU0J5A4_9HYPH|nr:hypothetical protein [Labrys wisconsinensis]MDQ0469447.1 hypothetical protein [Labrys wisconsinensis]
MPSLSEGPSRAAPSSGLGATLRRLPIALAVAVGGWVTVDLLDTDAAAGGDYDTLFMLGFLSVVMLPWMLSPAIEARRGWIRRAVSAARDGMDRSSSD